MVKKVKITDIAKATGFSPSAVSLAMRNQGNFKQETYDHILTTARNLGYNFKSQHKKSDSFFQSIALIVDNIQNPFFQLLYFHLKNEFNVENYFITLIGSDDDITIQTRILKNLQKDNNTGGIILVPATGTSEQDLNSFANSKIPTVLAVRSIPTNNFNYVGTNSMLGMKLATEHLINSGCQEIYFIGGYAKNEAYSNRYAGYTSVLNYHDIKFNKKWVINGGSSRTFGYNSMHTLLQKGIIPESVIGYNDFVAIGVMDALFKHNLQAGKDVKVVGYDNIPEAELRRTPLTTIENPAKEISLVISRFIHEYDPNVSEPILNLSQTPRLIIRQSCGNKES